MAPRTRKRPLESLTSVRKRVQRIDRRKLGILMSPWGSDKDSIGPVGSYYYSGLIYPDKQYVEDALAEVESMLLRVSARVKESVHGWSSKDVRELRRIASGLRYYLQLDY